MSGCITLRYLCTVWHSTAAPRLCGAGHHHQPSCHQERREKGQDRCPASNQRVTPSTHLKNSHLKEMASSECLSAAGKTNYAAGTECPAECPKGGQGGLPGYWAWTDPLRLFWSYRKAGSPKEVIWQADLADGEAGRQGSNFCIPTEQPVKGGVFQLGQSPESGTLHRGWRDINCK